jgi:Family of unknown function (DUF6093)
MSARDALMRGRAKAEAQMIDECIITDPGGSVTDPETGVVTRQSVTVYEGKCKVQSKDSATANPTSGERLLTVVSRQVHIPANAADVKDGHVVTIKKSELNLFTVGKKYRVSGFTPDTYDTAARLPVKEVT